MESYGDYWEEQHDHDHDPVEGTLTHGGGDDDHADPFPVPFLLVVIGYTLILTIDKVLFDAHDILDHSHDHDGVDQSVSKSYVFQDPKIKEAQLKLRESMTHYMRQSFNHDDASLSISAK